MTLVDASMGPLIAANLTPRLGYMVAAFTSMEIEFDAAIELMRQDSEVQARLGESAVIFEKRIDAFKLAAQIAFSAHPTLAQKLCALTTPAKLANLERNIVVHGQWSKHPKGWCAFLVKRGTRHARPVSENTLFVLTEQIGRITATLRMTFWGGPDQGQSDPLTPDERRALERLRGSAPRRIPTYAGPWPPPQSSRA